MNLFADTFFWIASTNPRDSAHLKARSILLASSRPMLVTTDEVLTEYLAYFSGAEKTIRYGAAVAVQRLLDRPHVRVIPQSRQSFLSGLELYLARPDKGYSLTDCISMQTMRREGLTEILTNDRHFEQEGFRALFRN
ncbi:MAG: PIN domain-containing protein [Bryobacterales bacterium]|nr:PIN domain-containing protein [Bryobacterales bacterium]